MPQKSALASLDKARVAFGPHPDVLTYQGYTWRKLGQFDKAVEWLERASEQKGDDATITEHLGDAYWHVGRKREARFEWERALNQKPDKDRVPVIKDKLANGLNAGNDKPTVYETPATPKQGG